MPVFCGFGACILFKMGKYPAALPRFRFYVVFPEIPRNIDCEVYFFKTECALPI